MSDQEKKSCCACGKGLATVGKVLLGLALIAVGGFLCVRWLLALQILIRGCLGPLLILIGLVFVAIAKE